MGSVEQEREVERLLMSVCDFDIADEDLARLNALLSQGADLRRHAAKHLKLDYVLRAVIAESDRTRQLSQFLEEYAANLKSEAQPLGLESSINHTCKSANPSNSSPSPAVRGISHLAWRKRLFSLAQACMIFAFGAIVYSHIEEQKEEIPSQVHFTDPGPRQVQATLTGMSGVQWVGQGLPALGAYTEPRLLRMLSGVVQISFDSNVECLIKGPAGFSHDGYGAIVLSHGTVIAAIPEYVRSFRVSTTSALVECESGSKVAVLNLKDGVTEVHVSEGIVRTTLLVDPTIDALDSGVVDRSLPKTQSVLAGYAVRIDRDTQILERIECNKSLRQEISLNRLDLVDLASGGDGTGDSLVYGINAITGEKIDPLGEPMDIVEGNGNFTSVSWNPVIDGVFVPSASSDKSLQVDSAGMLYHACPPNGGQTWNGGIMLHRTGSEQPLSAFGAELDWVYNWLRTLSRTDLGGVEGSFLGLHANCGITLDLECIREPLESKKLHRFHARVIYVPDKRWKAARPPVLTVIVDGTEFGSYHPRHNSPSVDVDIPITEDDRFLTLLSTDGDGIMLHDWMVLANPAFEFVDDSEPSM